MNHWGKKILYLFVLVMSSLAFGGCDVIYRLVDKKGAEEKQMLGDISLYVSNPKVQEVQMLLSLYGYSTGRVDGVFGPKTREAIGKFQGDAGLDVSSKMDQATWEQLHFFIEIGLVRDGKVDGILVQQVLTAAGFYAGKMDGQIGPKTKQALQNFQRKYELRPDGRIGYKTLLAMTDYLEW